MTISPLEAYSRWSARYDETPNPLLALEHRMLSPLLDPAPGQTFLDAGCGTGRWMAWVAARGARVFGIDNCREMILRAAHKPGLVHRCALADLSRQPFADNSFDTTICSFALGYQPSIEIALAEMARLSRVVIVSDLHPEAIRHGWTRSFRSEEEVWEIEHNPYSLANLDDAATDAELVRLWSIEARLGEPERPIFRAAGREAAFAAAVQVPAVLITAWHRLSD
jgi:SAM-dependent methyltransferase